MKKNNDQVLRLVFQILSFSLAFGFLVVTIAGSSYVIHEFCPYAVVCFGLSGGNFLNLVKVVMAEAVIFGFVVLIFSMFFGRKFCAWLCPLGSLQEWIYSLRGKKYRIKHRTPFYVERKLVWIKYLILVITCILVFIGLSYIYIRLCPFYGLSLLPRLALPGLIVMGIIIVKSYFGNREWCRYLCPYGALMNAAQWLGEKVGIRRKKIKRNLERCTDCGVCVLYCPMNLNLAESEYVQSLDCIHCGLCAQHCPKPGTYSEERECPK